jgi:hypothetical protein
VVTRLLTLLRISLVLFCLDARAETLGTGFENNSIDGWTVSGTLGATKNTWGQSGVGVALTTGVTNFSPGGGKTWNISPYGTHMASIQAGSAGTVSFDSAIGSLGLSGVENTAIKQYLTYQSQNGGGGNPTPTNASWMKKTFTLQAGVTYTMAWQYLSTDYTPYNDGSIMTLAHATNANITPTLNNTAQRYALLGFTNPGTGNYATGSYGATGWQVAQFTVPEAGDYTLGFASFNLGDTALSPILFIDVVQGSTTLNGQTFTPIQPNAGSTAPPPPEPGSTYSSGITAAQTTTKNTANTLRQGQHGNEIYVEQAGSYNNITIRQGTTATGKARIELYSNGDYNTFNLNQGKNIDGTTPALDSNNHYLYLHLSGNSNSVTTKQVDGTTAGVGHFMNSTISGNNNNITNIQGGSGAKILFQNINGGNNTVSTTQQDTGQHYLDLKLIGNNHAVTTLQSGSGNHAATIEFNNFGGASTLNMTQSGSTAQTYSIQQSCVNAAGCNTTITQP